MYKYFEQWLLRMERKFLRLAGWKFRVGWDGPTPEPLSVPERGALFWFILSVPERGTLFRFIHRFLSILERGDSKRL
jgi:hypothetical protein